MSFERLHWVSVPDGDGNCDSLPERLSIGRGCPKCGAAWVEFDQVGFEPYTVGGTFYPAFWAVIPHGSFSPVWAVQLVCYSGHRVRWDGAELVLAPPISTALLLGVGAIMLLGTAGWAVRR